MAIKKKGTPEKIEVVKESELNKPQKDVLLSIDFAPVKTGRLSGKKKKETK